MEGARRRGTEAQKAFEERELFNFPDEMSFEPPPGFGSALHEQCPVEIPIRTKAQIQRLSLPLVLEALQCTETANSDTVLYLAVLADRLWKLDEPNPLNAETWELCFRKESIIPLRDIYMKESMVEDLTYEEKTHCKSMVMACLNLIVMRDTSFIYVALGYLDFGRRVIPGWDLKWAPFCDSGPNGEYHNYFKIRAVEASRSLAVRRRSVVPQQAVVFIDISSDPRLSDLLHSQKLQNLRSNWIRFPLGPEKWQAMYSDLRTFIVDALPLPKNVPEIVALDPDAPSQMEDLELNDHLMKLHLEDLMREEKSVLVPLGKLRCGIARYRALLFKLLCDEAFPDLLLCRLVQAVKDHPLVHKGAWNVLVFREDEHDELFAVDIGADDLIDEAAKSESHPLHRRYSVYKAEESPSKAAPPPHTAPPPRGVVRGQERHSSANLSGNFPESENLSQSALKTTVGGLDFEDFVVDDTRTRVIGKGGFGEIQEVHGYFRTAPGEECTFARKKMKNEYEFVRELKMLMLSTHPHIVRLEGYTKEYIYMELMDIDLFNFLRNSLVDQDGNELVKYFDLTLTVLMAVASSLQFLHMNGIVHSDMKPANVLVKFVDCLEVKVGDLGGSRVVRPGSSHVPALSSDVAHFTPGYKSRQDRTYHGRMNDIHAFGVVMINVMTCGEGTYVEGLTDGVLLRVLRAKIAEMKDTVREDIIHSFVQLCLACVAPSRGERPKANAIYRRLGALHNAHSLGLDVNIHTNLYPTLVEEKMAPEEKGSGSCSLL